MWCRRPPKRTDAQKLRNIFLEVTKIRTKDDCDRFLSLVHEWEERYGQNIAKKLEKGRVFSDIKRARSILLKALPNMFHHLSYPQIPSSTNWIGGILF
ncbi:MAG: hypothetical protein DDT40_01452 [candidate division WS2 bacterium]|uniref:Uncharacterized protein n=1 Tax=Psychracetigena formicireducens TaxID=2986056 RepID=A0A9E2F492_PSYF1|nr:hypothetical protein [Candidatus Psychracetigena formicireducens]MBT9144761.1 hypothetical protein [Candidatus Psychracetigena formicireducens]MBT9151264.1 hypothetical protein [Candidatus Psychracetigena formicireducens]